jgi:hypothetical protein
MSYTNRITHSDRIDSLRLPSEPDEKKIDELIEFLNKYKSMSRVSFDFENWSPEIIVYQDVPETDAEMKERLERYKNVLIKRINNSSVEISELESALNKLDKDDQSK